MGITVLNRVGARIRHSELRRFVKAVLESLELSDAYLSIVFVSANEIKEYNLRFRNVDAETDVMAFTGEGDYLGDILICPEVVMKNSEELGVDFEDELKFVIVHGILHLLGYTDYTPEEKQKMFEEQRRLLEKVSSQNFNICIK